jgi:putative heme-binding domain-containing protein
MQHPTWLCYTRRLKNDCLRPFRVVSRADPLSTSPKSLLKFLRMNCPSIRAFLCVCSLFWLLSSNAFAWQEDPFQSLIRPSDPLSPEEQLKTFRVPEGFQMQLFASEPQIAKPLNMACDDRGRIWVTNTIEYPFAAPADREGRDSIKILEDTDGDGRADKITTFADKLNIPIGILPIKNGCIAFSIPHIWKLEDTDGDDHCDRRTVLYGPFGVDRDTHGMNNAFRLGLDGWVYACHGFNNVTSVSGTDGHVVEMQSGNTYRFRLDGSRIEQFTHGQVNPFGMTMDAQGNFFTSDCHSKPLYQLLQGGYYPSFGKPHDGLGFVPEMMQHSHNSTAIDGVCFYDDDRFPAEFRGNFFCGNVMTARVNRDRVEFHGSTMLAREMPDLVATSDPWFRPVDIQLGLDGALYIADFYNKIIGHYEVDLHHPGRDRTSGRIWRLVYRGEANAESAKPDISLLHADLQQIFAILRSANITLRLHAFQRLASETDQQKKAAIITQAAALIQDTDHDQQRAFCLWILERQQALTDQQLQAVFQSSGALTRLYAMQILAERTAINETQRRAALAAASDDVDAFVRRKAVEVLGLHPQSDDVVSLANLYQQLGDVAQPDLMLQHAVRIALKRILLAPDAYQQSASWLDDQEISRTLAEISIAVPTDASAKYLLDYLMSANDQSFFDANLPHLTEQIRLIAPRVPAEDIARLVQFAQEEFADQPEFQREILFAIQSNAAKDQPTRETLRPWATEIAERLLQQYTANRQQEWQSLPLPNSNDLENPWSVMQRDSADGTRADYLCTLPSGEQKMGVLRSPQFEAPAQLSFFAAGHNGFPKQAEVARNVIRLIDAQTNQVLRESLPPRNDLAQQFEWDLTDIAGRLARIEIVDGDSANAYAWIAVGRFDPAVVSVPQISPNVVLQKSQGVAEIVQRFQLQEFGARLGDLLREPQIDFASAAAFAQALAALRNSSDQRAIAQLIASPRTPEYQRQLLIENFVSNKEIPRLLEDSLRVLPTVGQLPALMELSRDVQGVASITRWLTTGKASRELLRNQTLQNQLMAVASEQDKQTLTQLVAELPAIDEQFAQRLAEVQSNFAQSDYDVEQGRAVFTRNCAICHQIGGVGKTNGPQLDGIGNRGTERMFEDIFEPNQNVDVAFRTTVLELADGRVLTGLLQNETNEQLLLVDAKGDPFTVAVAEVVDRYQTKLSLMPENWLDLLKPTEINDLLGFLSQQKNLPGE